MTVRGGVRVAWAVCCSGRPGLRAGCRPCSLGVGIGGIGFCCVGLTPIGSTGTWILGVQSRGV